MLYGNEIIFLCFIVAVTKWQAHRFDIEQKPVRHWLWALIFGAVIGLLFYLSHLNYYFGGALIAEHLVFFSPILNYFRKPRRAFFYIHSDPKKGSWLDKVLSKMPVLWRVIWIISLAGFITLQFFI